MKAQTGKGYLSMGFAFPLFRDGSMSSLATHDNSIIETILVFTQSHEKYIN